MLILLVFNLKLSGMLLKALDLLLLKSDLEHLVSLLELLHIGGSDDGGKGGEFVHFNKISLIIIFTIPKTL